MPLAILPLGALLLSPTLPPPARQEPQAEAPRFAAPALLTGGDEPLGRGILYPSPALFDIDGDGARELVIGDLFGRVRVAEKLPGEDALAWSAPEPLQAADGEELKFHNW
jgi:hypothetical protein